GRPWARPAALLDDEALARYLQLPPLAPRVGALARDVTTGSRDSLETARRLTTFLSRGYRYTLALERQTALDPVEEFLFVRRSGNCEYFAAALAVMLRSLGIPARVVNGFQRGEWNPYGRYFMVRLRDAHSWVEAYVERQGWVTLDPSPRGAVDAAGAIGPLGLYLDALRMRWQRYVINWSLRDQMEAALAVRRHASTGFGPWLGAARGLGEGPILRLLAAAGALGVVVVAWRARRGGVSRRAPAASRAPRFYTRALRALARGGLAPAAGETAREFSRRVAARAPACAGPFTRLTAAYERCRFGALPPAGDEAAALDACLATLERARPRAR
ncbi:MAG: transglutaminase domain-containing protein, partial [Candidatus Rokubacteria bacterium]|nr:transglutaminase domain-containing protein [Candidatus Rokubacteria bacterium]